jgi:ectoine hydroxylase-related dioxygenase (phytanoyl-CoA dioxygenase family)
MIKYDRGYICIRHKAGPAASVGIEQRGYAVLRKAFDAREVAALRKDIERVFRECTPDYRRADKSFPWEEFRYEMLNRSAACQKVVADRRILDIIEPLLGEDCHVIANTAWRNSPRAAYRHSGGSWHVDSGPHVPRSPGIPWDDRIPYPIFAIGVHVFLRDCPESCGPTAVIPGSHKSGLAPPMDRPHDRDLQWQGQGPVVLTAKAGDVVLFSSDVWHRRAPTTEEDAGRFFLQVHYGRRNIAQRLRTTKEVNHLSEAAVKRAITRRQQTVVGLHGPSFYDG